MRKRCQDDLACRQPGGGVGHQRSELVDVGRGPGGGLGVEDEMGRAAHQHHELAEAAVTHALGGLFSLAGAVCPPDEVPADVVGVETGGVGGSVRDPMAATATAVVAGQGDALVDQFRRSGPCPDTDTVSGKETMKAGSHGGGSKRHRSN